MATSATKTDPAPEATKLNPLPRVQVALPRGFRNVLENLAREILRNQPTNIYQFSVEYFDKVLAFREQGITDSFKSNKADNNPYTYKPLADDGKAETKTANYVDSDTDVHDTDPAAHAAASKIQKAFREKQSTNSTEESQD